MVPVSARFAVFVNSVSSETSKTWLTSQLTPQLIEKKRSSNFSDVEKAAIREGFVGCGDLLGKKFANKVGGNTKVQQDNAWMKITQAVNAVGRAFRTVDEVKEKHRKMVSCAKAVVAKENANARQTGGGKPMPIPDDTTLAIIQDMKGTPAFSGIPGSSASESAIVAVNRQDEPQKDPFNLLGFDALTGSPSRTWSMFEVACSSGMHKWMAFTQNGNMHLSVI
ncbi:uncharacterized protein LOC128246163 [Mya arenaria]|uniref:uncharacterized protein LOC128246163 n=1 Tax=Mya arenaria TaxID=6604 RepID=UPI0022DF7998|nr:uncharacterized protein LOC128246163 [Mya arenaria]